MIFSSFFCLIISHFLMTKCLTLYVLCKEKLCDNKWLGLKRLKIDNFEVCALSMDMRIGLKNLFLEDFLTK